MVDQMALGEFYACPESLMNLAPIETARVFPATSLLPEQEDARAQLREPLSFFSLAVSNIGGKKTMFIPAGLSGHIAADDIAVTQHELMETPKEGQYIVRTMPDRPLTRCRAPTWTMVTQSMVRRSSRPHQN